MPVSRRKKTTTTKKVPKKTPSLSASPPAGGLKEDSVDDTVVAKSMEWVFGGERDATNPSPYNQHGNIAMYEPGNLEKRLAHRSNAALEELINRYAELFQRTAEGSVVFEAYARVHAHCIAVLIPSFTQEEIDEAVQEDWEHDSQSSPDNMLTSNQLFDSIFELVDTWTLTTRENEYTAFCEMLHARVSERLGTLESERPQFQRSNA